MASPSVGDLHVNRLLTTASVKYMQDAKGFVADQVFPILPVSNKSDSYLIYNRGDWYRDEAKIRPPATQSAGGGFAVTTATYSAKVWAYHKDIDDQLRANVDSEFNLDRDAVDFVSLKLLIARERQWATAFFKTGVWGRDVTPSTKWDSSIASPIAQIRSEITSMASKGLMPNTLVLGPEVAAALMDSPELIERIKYNQVGIVGLDLVASLLGLEQVLVANGVVNTAIEGATESTDFVFGDSALLTYSRRLGASQLQPSAGYTFSWTGYIGAGAMGQRIKTFRMEELAADRVEGEMAYDMKIVAPELGTFFNDVLST